MQEIKPLTSVRMIAALLVVLYHHPFAPYDNVIINSIAQEGHIGVGIFFVLSGFLITLRYYDVFAKYGLSRSILYDFFVKRFARIYPLYAFTLIVVIAFRTDVFSKTKILLTFTFAHGYFSELRVLYLPVAWTLVIEESFYLLAPLMLLSLAAAYRYSPGLKSIVLALAAWTIGLFLLGAFLITVPLPRPFAFMDFPFVYMGSFTILGRFIEFGTGAFIAILYQKGYLTRIIENAMLCFWMSVVAVAGIVICQYFIHLGGGIEKGRDANHPILIFTALGFISILSINNPIAKILNYPVLVYGGRISYAVYLVHTTVLMFPFYQIFPPQEPVWIYHGGIYLGATILGVILYECIEKPARTRILALAERYKKWIVRTA